MEHAKQTATAVRRRFLLAACALACAAAAPQALADWGWGGETAQGNGKVVRQARSVAGFSGVALSLPGKVEVRTVANGGGAEGVTVETDENLLPLIETVVEEGTLKIRAKRNTSMHMQSLRIVVQARGIERLALGGSGNIDADRVAGPKVRFDIGGSGTITARRVEGQDVSVNLGGSGGLKAQEGTARSLSVSIGGSGKVDLAGVRSDTASVTVGGSGDATLWVRDTLSVTIAGSGNVGYYGDPQLSSSMVGSGKVRQLGPAPR